MYGASPVNGYNSSLSLGYGVKAAGTWSIAIGNGILTNAEASSLCNVAVGSQNLQNLVTVNPCFVGHEKNYFSTFLWAGHK